MRNSCGPLKLLVGIATTGRPEILRQTIDHVRNQTRPPDQIVVAPISDSDIEGLDRSIQSLSVAYGSPGLPCQRNAILREANGFDILVFFDDDFFPCTDYLAEVEDFFQSHPNTAVMTGRVIADGIHGPGIQPVEAEKLLVEHTADQQSNDHTIAPTYNGYGCNMSIRLRDVLTHNLMFDENLPQYGWLEDLDFSRRLAEYGDVTYFSGAKGVHLGTKKGRQSGIKLGYSQIANVVYLMRKGTCNRSIGLRTMGRNIAMNMARSLLPEPHIDRTGRLYGNAKAMSDMIRGRLDPRNIELM